MANLTKSKIAYDLHISPHKHSLTYSDGETLTFIFSSNLYKEKFKEQLAGNREKFNSSLTNRFGITIVNNKLCDLKLYSTLEKRGFLIIKGQVKHECLNNITLDGQTLIEKH